MLGEWSYNGLTSYFASWLDKDTDIGPQGASTPSTLAYNNFIEINETSIGGALTSSGAVNNALIIKKKHSINTYN